MLLVGPLGHADRRDGVLGGEHVPGAICPENQAAVSVDIHGINPYIWFRTDHKHVFLTIVGPEIAKRPSDSKEGNLIDVGGPAHGTLVAHLGPVPHNPGHPGLADHLPSALRDPLALL